MPIDLFINLFFAGVVAFTDVRLQNVAHVPLPAPGHVSAIEFRPSTAVWNKTFDCRYFGLLVPFVRDWEEVIGGSESQTIRAAEPDKQAGYAVVINKLKCPDEEEQAVFNVADWYTRAKPGLFAIRSQMFNSVALRPNPDLQPKWLSQVMNQIASAAETDPVAKNFLEFTHQAEAKAKAAKSSALQEVTGAVVQ
jgi:hypothetical protein